MLFTATADVRLVSTFRHELSSCSRKMRRSFNDHRSPTVHEIYGHTAVVGQDNPTVRGTFPPVKLIHIRQPAPPRPRDTPMPLDKLCNFTCTSNDKPASVTAIVDFSTRSPEIFPPDAQCVENHVDALEANDE